MAEFLSIVNAAAYLNVDYKTIYRLVRSGRLLSSRVGGQYRITREDLETYLDTQKANIASAAQDPGSGKSPMKT
ncbi:MAG: helix-turn-helix domain-containing protein, partial [Anaerolineae bacterium]